MTKRIIAEASPFLLVVIAVVLGVLIVPLGMIHTVIKPFYDNRKRPFKERMKYVGKWLLRLLYQIWVVVKYILFQIAYIIDVLSNVLIGEAIEDIITHKEDTMLGNGNISISAAIGDIKKDDKALNGRGKWLDRVLSKIDRVHDDHCGAAIKLWEFKKSLRNDANQ